jgi:hypothetical protein
MGHFRWRPFLERFSRDLLASEDIRSELPPEVLQSGWLGFPAASAKELAGLEARLGVRLPASYREFLATTNGWRETGYFIWELWPTSKVDWFAVNNQDWIDAYTEPARGEPPLAEKQHRVYGKEQNCCVFRVEYLQSALQISEHGDSAVYLLSPEVRTRSGEWEAWFFANWCPGARRYRSFWEMMHEELRSFIRLREGNTGG